MAARLAQERGFTLIEVVVSAALLAVVTAGVYAGIDGPTRISGNAKARAAAADLAQANQERMRAMRFADLQNYAPAGQPQVVDGVRYTVTSRADWVEDSSAAAGCSTGNSKGDYLKLSSTVSWPSGGSGDPLVATSLMAPPVNDGANGTGNIIVHLKDQTGAPVAGIPVMINGRTTLTRTTDAAGCAVFASVPAGDYTSSFSQSGYVDDQGIQAVSIPTPVKSGATQQVEHLYARAGSVTVSFKGSNGSSLNWTKASVGGGSLSAPRVLTGTTSPLTTGKVLYPSTTGSYAAWAGGCADPGASYEAAAAVTPGNDTPAAVTVPTLTFQMPKGSLSSAPRIRIKPVDPTCTDSYTLQTAASGSNYAGAIAVPFGNYTVCADQFGYMTASPYFTEANSAPGGTTITMGLTQSGNNFNVTATRPDGTTQSTGVTSGTCP